MKDSRFLKIMATLLSLLLIIQSCQIYDKPTTLTEAVSTGEAVKVVTKSGKKENYGQIYYEDNRLFGKKYYHEYKWYDSFLPISRAPVEKTIQLNEDDIRTIQLENQMKSALANIGLAGVFVGLIVYAIRQSEIDFVF
jgi:hypothetical protein